MDRDKVTEGEEDIPGDRRLSSSTKREQEVSHFVVCISASITKRTSARTRLLFVH